MTVQVPTRLSTDALVKRATLGLLVALIFAHWLSALDAAIVGVASFYLLLSVQNTQG